MLFFTAAQAPGATLRVLLYFLHSYLSFHVLQFFETTLGTVVSVLCNQALLESVGVSAEGSIFGAVAVQWIIKDGAGEVAKLFFIRKFSPYFDSHPKTFTLFGETIVAVGSGLQIGTLLVNPSPGNFLLCAGKESTPSTRSLNLIYNFL